MPSSVHAAPLIVAAPSSLTGASAKRSPAWQFFEAVEADDKLKARCRIPTIGRDGKPGAPCGNLISIKNVGKDGTSNMFRHLSKEHPSEALIARLASGRSTLVRRERANANQLADGRQPTLDNTFAMPKRVRTQHDRRWVIGSAVDCLPCSAIGNVGMQAFVGGLNAPYVSQVTTLI